MASQAVRKGGTVQITVFMEVGIMRFPLGDFFQRNVDIKMGQAPVIPYMPFLYNLIEKGK